MGKCLHRFTSTIRRRAALIALAERIRRFLTKLISEPIATDNRMIVIHHELREM
jgi:hypothetical protein